MDLLIGYKGSPPSAASTIAAYNPDVFNALTTPDQAYDYVKSVNGEEALKTVVRDLFIKHNMCDKFGITLLHRHFDMAASEKVVAVGGTSTPWDTPSCEDESLGRVIPQAFIYVSPNEVVPFEYTFFTNHTVKKAIDLSVSASKEFVEEVGALLFSLKLEKVLGLRAYPNLPGVHHIEFTVDRANIFVEVEHPVPNSIPTSWFFCSGAVNECRCKLKCVGYCVKSCHPSSSGHYKHHQGQHDRPHSGNHYGFTGPATSRVVGKA